jgi:hypothetical protein
MTDQLVFDAPLPPEMFYGRDTLIERICERLRRPQFQSSTVFGGPKMGKTSLFRFLCSDRADPHYHGKPLMRIYFDAQIVGSNSTENDFWTGVLKGLSEQPLPEALVGLLNEKLAKASIQNLTKFDVFDVFDTCAKSGTPVALFIDNFDTPLRNEHFWTGSDFYHNLRFLDEREPRGLSYVVASCRPVRDYWRPAAVSPFFNTWLDFALEPFTSEQLAHWVERWLAGTRKTDEKTIQEIVRRLWGHEREFCSRCWWESVAGRRRVKADQGQR